MPHWETELYLYDLHKGLRDKTATVEEIAPKVADRLEKNPYGTELKDLIERFRGCQDLDAYDDLLELLYDFADDGHRIWVNTLVRRDYAT